LLGRWRSIGTSTIVETLSRFDQKAGELDVSLFWVKSDNAAEFEVTNDSRLDQPVY
jgi:hypothetical protein